MNNTEIDKIMKIKKKVKELNENVISLNHFLRTYSNSFVNENSKEALERIEKYTNRMINERAKDNEEIQKISESIDCNHELIINVFLEYECPICKRRFKLEDGKNSKYVVSCYYDYEEDEEDINKIILDACDEDDACEKLLLYFSEKQTEGNINIRRLLK